jgi:hypothetical protein
MREIVPGLVHWTAEHAPIGQRVSSYFLVPAGVIIDPKVPDGGLDALAEVGRPRHVVLTSGHHVRDSARFAEAFGCPIRASRPAAEHAGGAVPIVTFADGEEVVPGVTGIEVGVLCPDEGALYLDAPGGALALADALYNAGGRPDFFPDALLGDDPVGVRAGLRQAFARLLARDFAHLLFAHGDPIVGEGRAALEAAARPAGAAG